MRKSMSGVLVITGVLLFSGCGGSSDEVVGSDVVSGVATYSLEEDAESVWEEYDLMAGVASDLSDTEAGSGVVEPSSEVAEFSSEVEESSSEVAEPDIEGVPKDGFLIRDGMKYERTEDGGIECERNMSYDSVVFNDPTEFDTYKTEYKLDTELTSARIMEEGYITEGEWSYMYNGEQLLVMRYVSESSGEGIVDWGDADVGVPDGADGMTEVDVESLLSGE